MSWQDKEHYARLRSGERPGVRREFGRAQTRAVLVYPNSYHVGMSNLGFQTIYRLGNSTGGLLCDRFFPLDWSSSDPPLSIDCEKPLSDFDVLAFSVAYENDYLNVLKTLDMARIPHRAEERDDSFPLVVIGGAVTYINPEPIAEFTDVIVMGEGEEPASRLFDLLRRARDGGRGKLLAEAADIGGVYVPAIMREGPPEAREPSGAWGRVIPEDRISFSAIVAKETEFSDTLLVEISRGCPYRCRFCAVGHGHPHFRSASADDVLGIVQRRLFSGGLRPSVRRVGLVSSAVGSHPGLDRICEGLRSMGLEIGVSSLRVDRLSDFMLRCLADSGTRTITIAPEAGTERLRLVAGKDIPQDAVIDGAARAVEHGIPNVRLYFMVGLPTETDEDMEGLMELAVKVRRAMDGGVYALTKAGAEGGGAGVDGAAGAEGGGRGVRVGGPGGSEGKGRGHRFDGPTGTDSRGRAAGMLTVSLAPFVPKPGTPLQWCAMASAGDVKRTISMIRRGLGRHRGIKVTSEGLRSAYLQGILARGGREAWVFLEEALRMDGDWKAAASNAGMDLQKALGRMDMDEPAPWHSMLGEKRLDELTKEYRRALSWVKE